MAICPQCGTDNPDNASFCGNCGTALAQGSASPSPSPSGMEGQPYGAGTDSASYGASSPDLAGYGTASPGNAGTPPYGTAPSGYGAPPSGTPPYGSAPSGSPSYGAAPSGYGTAPSGASPYGMPRQYVEPYPTGGLVAWSIITLLLCTIPGIVALVNVNGINKCFTVEEQQKKIKNAKTWCIVGTVLGVLSLIVTISQNLL